MTDSIKFKEVTIYLTGANGEIHEHHKNNEYKNFEVRYYFILLVFCRNHKFKNSRPQILELWPEYHPSSYLNLYKIAKSFCH